MIKLIFIFTGVIFVFYGLYKMLVKDSKNSKQHSELNAFSCDYCNEYITKKPEFENSVCNICNRRVVKADK